MDKNLRYVWNIYASLPWVLDVPDINWTFLTSCRSWLEACFMSETFTLKNYYSVQG